MSRHQTDVQLHDISTLLIEQNRQEQEMQELTESMAWKSTEINGTFMRYQMTHQIHLAVNTPQALSLTLAALVDAYYSPCNLRWLGQSWGTHLHLPLGQPLLSGPLANVIRVTSLEGYSGHGPLTKADLPTNSPSQPASTSLFKVFKKKS